MSHHRTDRGFVVIKREPDGTSTVAIGTSVMDGRLDGIFALHVHVSTVDVDPRIKLTTAGPWAHTSVPIDVFRAEGGLSIRP